MKLPAKHPHSAIAKISGLSRTTVKKWLNTSGDKALIHLPNWYYAHRNMACKIAQPILSANGYFIYVFRTNIDIEIWMVHRLIFRTKMYRGS